MSRPLKEKRLQVLMTLKEYQALAEYASRMQLTMSEVIRDFALEIRHLFLAVLRCSILVGFSSHR
jgi:hypothetical protein